MTPKEIRAILPPNAKIPPGEIENNRVLGVVRNGDGIVAMWTRKDGQVCIANFDRGSWIQAPEEVNAKIRKMLSRPIRAVYHKGPRP